MPTIYVFLGLIASGKSTLAQRFADCHGLPYYNTDRVRKELAGLDARQQQADRYNQGIYTGEFSRKTYEEMLRRAQTDIRAGARGVVLDGSYHKQEERDRVRRLADAEGARTIFVLCICSDAEVKKRLAQRAEDPDAVSDGRWEIYQVQKEVFQPPAELRESELITLDTERPVAELLQSLSRNLEMEADQDCLGSD